MYLIPLWFLSETAHAACPYPTPDLQVCAACTHTTLTSAVAAASAGDQICVAPGTYTAPLTIAIDLAIGADNPGVILSASTGTEMVKVQSGASVELNGVEIAGNSARRCALVTNASSELVLVNGSVHDCAANVVGPGIWLQNGTSFRSTDTDFVNNGNNGNDGGALLAETSNVTITGGTFSANTAQDGGAISFVATSATVTDVTFELNHAGTDGGAVWSNANLDISGCTFDANSANSWGGGVYQDAATLTMLDSVVTDNTSTGNGAGVVLNTTGSFTRVLFVANLANGDGGAIYTTNDNLTVLSSTFFSNDGDNGGAIYATNDGNTSIKRSDFWENAATNGSGGAALLESDGTNTINNNVFSSNSASGNGGGLRTRDDDFTVRNNVFVDNTAVDGDAILHSGGGGDQVDLRNNIIAHHGAAVDEQSGVIDAPYNAFFSNSTNSDAGTNITNAVMADPQFVLFSNNNTFDDNVLVNPGSPCIDAGDPGINDLGGGRSDIGIGGGPDSRDQDRDLDMPPSDCDDTDADVSSTATEIPGSGVDENCDGEELCFEDTDVDGFGDPTAIVSTPDLECDTGVLTDDDQDCDDTDNAIHPGAAEVPNDDTDQDCDGFDSCFQDLDQDQQGTTTLLDSTDNDCVDPGESVNSNDCDDTDDDRFLGNPEVTGDLKDQDCDGRERCWVDADADGFGNDDGVTGLSTTSNTCPTAQSLADDDDDCDDSTGTIKPGVAEVPGDGVDQNCDTDETCYVDGDNDDHGAAATVVSNDLDCVDAGEAPINDDCNDGAVTVFPGATEVVADGVDQNCDTDELCWRDVDGDNYGGNTTIVSNDLDCTDPNEEPTNTDCNDTAGAGAAIHPGASEVVADGVDQNCNGGDACYRDLDNDDYGITMSLDGADLDCTDANEASNSTDCNDAATSVNPGATEIPANGVDETCNGQELCYRDSDSDGYGSTTTQQSSNLMCVAAGVSNNDDDCDDALNTVNPAAAEVTGNNRDDDCNGTSRCWADTDRDGYGATSITESPNAACTTADGEATNDDDCLDTRAASYPGATEVKENGFDDDCDGFDLVDCLVDDDGDGYGVDPAELDEFEADCDALAGYVSDIPANQGDCDDSANSVHPGAVDTQGDGIDSNCDGILDEDGDGLAYEQEVEQGSSDAAADTDGDGLTDLQEYNSCDDMPTRTGCLNPTTADTDGDGLTDLSEFGEDHDGDGIQDGLDPDDDGDGVPTSIEVTTTPFDYDGDGTDNALDTDDDGDGVETIDEGGGDPLADTDGDRVLDWLDDDDDGDGVLTVYEIAVGSDHLSGDSDGDTVSDGIEWPTAPAEPPDTDGDSFPDLLDDDDDDDGLFTLREELELSPDGDGIPNRQDSDSDNDGRPDSVELDGDDDDDNIPNFVDFNDSDGLDGDGDGDGISNRDEGVIGTNPLNPDSDGDLLPDGWEATGTNAPNSDGDALVDALDPDDDDDGVLTRVETGFLDLPLQPIDVCAPISCELRCDTAFVGLNPAGPVFLCDGLEEAMPSMSDLRDTDDDGAEDPFDPNDDGDRVDTVDESADNSDGDCFSDAYDLDPRDGPDGDFDADSLANADECLDGFDPYSDDTDGDGIPDGIEAPLGDSDADGMADALDPDDDGDGVPTAVEGSSDTDGDTVQDYLDGDADGDGVNDGDEPPGDSDCDGVPDRIDAVAGTCALAAETSKYSRSGCEHAGGLGGLGGALLALAFARRRSR